MKLKMSLSFPYKYYPKYPLAGYLDVAQYNKQLSLLIDYFMKLQKSTSSILFHIAIGGAMEEYLHFYNKTQNEDSKEDYISQWRQLFPIHIENACKSGISVRSIIICPNESFNPTCFKDPLFIKHTPEFEWIKDNMSYKSNKYDIEIDIFYTLMPSVNKNSEEIYCKLTDLYKEYDIIIHEQTDYDKEIINNFYKTMNDTFEILEKHGSCITCFSYAVFNVESLTTMLPKYYLFSEIIQLFKTETRILAEWKYIPNCYSLKIYDADANINYNYCDEQSNYLTIFMTNYYNKNTLNIGIINCCKN